MSARRVYLDIEGGHDRYEISTEDGAVFIVLNSTGTFKVKLNLYAEDAAAFATALEGIAAIALADSAAIRERIHGVPSSKGVS